MTERPTLPHIVECKSSYPFFEPIAAFDCLEAARAYKENCEKTNRRFAYRVNSIYGGE
jgi:hypothetical protein